MAIDFDTLFERLGRIGRLAYLVNTYQSDLPAALESLYASYDGLTPGAGLRDVISPAISLRAAVVADAGRWLPVLQDAARLTLLSLVADDNPAAAGSVGAALAELRRQMLAGSESVKACTVTAAAAALSGMSGDGVVVVTAKGGDGLTRENLFGETGRLVCTADSFGGGATAGEEPFAYVGEVGDPGDVWAYDWPAGSGVSTPLQAVGPDSAANLLTNSDFETFTTANTPDNWVIAAGTAGTEVFEETSTVYSGAACVRVAGSATNVAITQAFAADELPAALTSYGVNLWVRVDVVPAAGVLAVELVDGTGTVVTDAAAVANSFTVDLTGLTAATWTNAAGVFRLPKALPAGLSVRLRLSTALSAGTNLYLDRLAVGPVTYPYPGGPGVSVFSGASPFAANDGWLVAGTNDRGGATFAATFQALFDRLFATRELGVLLPSDAGPTRADTLITAP